MNSGKKSENGWSSGCAQASQSFALFLFQFSATGSLMRRVASVALKRPRFCSQSDEQDCHTVDTPRLTLYVSDGSDASYPLTTTLAGSNYWNRVGNVVRLERFVCRVLWFLTFSNLSARGRNFARVAVVYDSQPGVTALRMQDVFNGADYNGSSVNGTNPFVSDSRYYGERFQVLYDEAFVLPPVGALGQPTTSPNPSQIWVTNGTLNNPTSPPVQLQSFAPNGIGFSAIGPTEISTPGDYLQLELDIDLRGLVTVYDDLHTSGVDGPTSVKTGRLSILFQNGDPVPEGETPAWLIQLGGRLFFRDGDQ
jgi:hypothetical protein